MFCHFCDANGCVALICGCRCEPRIILLNVALSESFYGVGWTLCSLANCLTHEWESIYCRARTCLLLCLTTSRPALFGVTNKSQKRYIGSVLTGVVRSSVPFVGSPRGRALICYGSADILSYIHRLHVNFHSAVSLMLFLLSGCLYVT